MSDEGECDCYCRTHNCPDHIPGEWPCEKPCTHLSVTPLLKVDKVVIQIADPLEIITTSNPKTQSTLFSITEHHALRLASYITQALQMAAASPDPDTKLSRLRGKLRG